MWFLIEYECAQCVCGNAWTNIYERCLLSQTIINFFLFCYVNFLRRKNHGVVKASARVDRFSKSDIIVSPSILSANFSKLGEQVWFLSLNIASKASVFFGLCLTVCCSISLLFFSGFCQVKAVELAGCDWIHVDVMDGRFVPNITIGPLVVDALRPVTDLPLDVHLVSFCSPLFQWCFC